jgi:hypothetical protein
MHVLKLFITLTISMCKISFHLNEYKYCLIFINATILGFYHHQMQYLKRCTGQWYKNDGRYISSKRCTHRT